MPSIPNALPDLKIEIDKLYMRLTALNGVLYHFAGIIKGQNDRINATVNKGIESDIPSYFYGANFIISDISGITDNGWLLHFVTKSYFVGQHNYDSELQDMLRKQSSYSISQAYEALISFYKQCVKVVAPAVDSSNWKAELRFSKLLDAVPELKQTYKSNNLGLNVELYFKALSFFRHKTTHDQLTFDLSDKEYNRLENDGRAVLKRFFPYTKKGKQFEFDMPVKLAMSNLKIIGEIAFQAFKQIAILNDDDWQIFKGMPAAE